MNRKVAEYWDKINNNNIDDNNFDTAGAVKCGLCPHFCLIGEGCSGKCGVRVNDNGVLYSESYGRVTSVALDPIEKKPLYKFYSGKKIVSVGSYGCNFHCPFCQNFNISMEYKKVGYEIMTPELLVEVALSAVSDGNIGVAYTYNEPLIGYEYIKECSRLIKKKGLMNILVTNGYINKKPLDELLPMVDAMNIDIKGNNERTYNMVGGTQEVVINTIETADKVCHVEVTTLIIPGENENEVENIAKLLSKINPGIPYHLSRFFPRYKYADRSATPLETMYKAYDTAKKYLQNVYLGNM